MLLGDWPTTFITYLPFLVSLLLSCVFLLSISVISSQLKELPLIFNRTNLIMINSFSLLAWETQSFLQFWVITLWDKEFFVRGFVFVFSFSTLNVLSCLSGLWSFCWKNLLIVLWVFLVNKKLFFSYYSLESLFYPSVQFSLSVVSDLCDPMNRNMPGLAVHHQLPESTQTHVHWVSDTIQPSHPLPSPSPPALNLSQHQGLFKWVSSSHQVAKVLEF